jgi:spermidine synthase
LSGFAGLVYETCWTATATLVFGSTTLALSTVLATFFAGLAIGSHVFGRWSQHTTRPLALYAALEVALAALGLASPYAFDLADAVYGWAYGALAAEHPVGLAMLRNAVVAVLLLPPAIAMGGTLPLVCRELVVDPARITRSVGALYAVNTLGAAAGCAATGFWLLPLAGTTGTLRTAAALNLAAAAFALAVARRRPRVAPTPAATADVPAPQRRWVGGLVLAGGVVGLGSQVLWARFLALVVRNTVHTYTVTLTVVLCGIVLGSAAARRLDRERTRAFAFGALQAGTALSLLLLLHLPPALWSRLGSDLAVCALLMLPGATCAGAAFPLGIRLAVADPARAGAAFGRLTALSTIGGIAGALGVGFVGLPRFGMAASAQALAAIGVLAAIAAWLALAEGRVLRRLAAAALAGAAWIAIPRALGTSLPADLLGPRELLVGFAEGQGASLATLREDGTLRLYIDRLWQGEDEKTHQIMAAHVPMLLAPKPPSEVLVVGFGTGQAASRFLMYEIDRLDCLDIEPAVFDFVRAQFDPAWMRDPRVRTIHEDGRTYVAHTKRQYDLISLEVGQLFRPGAAAFYTREFYARAKERLRPGGAIAQFVPLVFLDPEMLRRVVRTFRDVFPECVLWYNTQELLLVGAADESIEVTPDRVLALSDPEIRDDLRYSHWGGNQQALAQPECFLAGFLCGARALAELAGDAEPLRDDRPDLAWAAAAADEASKHEIAGVELLRGALDPLDVLMPEGTGVLAVDAILSLREQNLADLVARAHLRHGRALWRAGRKAEGADSIVRALEANPDDLACLRARAEVHGDAGEHAAAIALYRRVIGASDVDALAHRDLGLTLLQTGEDGEALAHLQRAVELRPKDAIAHNYLGAALARRGRIPEAITHLERALELRPGYRQAQVHLDTIKNG